MIHRSFVLASVIVLAGCSSRFQESPPDSVNTQSVHEQLKAKAEFDQQLNRIQSSAQKMKSALGLLLQSSHLSTPGYTSADMLMDLSHELKKGLPQKVNGRYVKRGQVQVPATTEDCQKVDTMISGSSEDRYASLSIKSCFTHGEYVEVLQLMEAQEGGFTLSLDPRPFRAMLNTAIEDWFTAQASECRFSENADDTIDAFYCKNMRVELDGGNVMVIDPIIYSESSDNRLTAYGFIFDSSGQDKAQFELTVDTQGHIDLQMEKSH